MALNKGEKLKVIIIDCESMNNLDSSGVHALIETIDLYSSKGIEITFSGVKGPVRDVMEKGGVISKLGIDNFYMSIQDAVDAYELKNDDKQAKQKFEKFIKQTNT